MFHGIADPNNYPGLAVHHRNELLCSLSIDQGRRETLIIILQYVKGLCKVKQNSK